MIYKLVQSAGCGYAGLDPLVCCPITYENHKITTRLHTTDIDAYRSTDPDVWVWGSTQFPTHIDAITEMLLDASSTNGRTTKRRSKEFYDETDVFDFIDPKTQRNFPHSFYEESVDSHDMTVGDKKHYNGGGLDQKNFKHHSHKHHHHFGGHSYFPYHNHQHEYQHERDNVYDDNEYIEGEDEYPRTIFRPISDGPIVYPDDRRLIRPLKFPTITATTATTTTTTTTTKKPTSKPLERSKVNNARCGMPDIDAGSGERLYPWISRIAYINKSKFGI